MIEILWWKLRHRPMNLELKALAISYRSRNQSNKGLN